MFASFRCDKCKIIFSTNWIDILICPNCNNKNIENFTLLKYEKLNKD